MCGRYTLFSAADLPERFHISEEEVQELKEFLNSYNISPSRIEPTIINKDGERHIEAMRWGYMPPWGKDPKEAVFKYKTFNTRSEEAFDKPTWKNAIRHTRCLVPSNGFFEWRAISPRDKQKFFIRPKDQDLFAFAGIYRYWQDPEAGIEIGTYSILTTSPNREMESIHTRMPVILKPNDEDRWLEPSNETPESLADLLRPYEDGMLEVYEVSRDSDKTHVDDETVIAPLHA